MGDVKLALLLGVVLGRTVPVGLMIGMLAALVPVGRAARAARQAARKMAIPFGPFLALGGVARALRRPADPPRISHLG